MAKFLVVCAKNGVGVPDARVARACALMTPENLAQRPPALRRADGLVLAVVEPTPSVLLDETSACVGRMLVESSDWAKPGAPVPEGSFALVRADRDTVELATDAAGTRSIFYAFDGDLFVASSSQRAIIAVLGGFQLDREAVSWMISAGVIGPGCSWDRRIRRLGADGRVMLDRRDWSVGASSRKVVFAPRAATERHHAQRLKEAVLSACECVELGDSTWQLPLSGGYDSRMLLLSIGRRHPLRCITWGTRSALEDPENDAWVARSLAQHVGAAHEYYVMEPPHESFDAVLSRFVSIGEGCVENLGAYTDNFDIWRRLHDSGVSGVIRGDEGFGWKAVLLEGTVRAAVGATMLADFYSLDGIEQLGLAQQAWPAELEREPGESLATWRDRLYHAYRTPNFLASLTELKTPFVEVINPLMSRRILDVVREMPDELRTGKRAFCALVESMSPPVPFASRPAIPVLGALSRSPAARALARAEMQAGVAEGSLPPRFVEHVLANLADGLAPPRRRSGGMLAKAVRSMVPRAVRTAVRSLAPRPPPYATLAFRSAIVAKTARMLRRDAES